ncbi:hypothetical protein WJX73_007112 [Symbiochloris irregularis]|uniref:HMA domain-containing protein n=1 Tax=Symbiochloris irregularis TaxID=706552 RepID=A0AAW1NQA8_9CHLO
MALPLQLLSLRPCAKKTSLHRDVAALPLAPAQRSDRQASGLKLSPFQASVSQAAPLQAKSARRSPLRAAVAVEAAPDTELMELDLKIEGMVCEHCVARVADALRAVQAAGFEASPHFEDMMDGMDADYDE